MFLWVGVALLRHGETERQRDSETERQRDRGDRETERQRDRETVRSGAVFGSADVGLPVVRPVRSWLHGLPKFPISRKIAKFFDEESLLAWGS